MNKTKNTTKIKWLRKHILNIDGRLRKKVAPGRTSFRERFKIIGGT